MDATEFMRIFYRTGILRVLVYLIPGQKARLAYWNSFYCITFNVFFLQFVTFHLVTVVPGSI